MAKGIIRTTDKPKPPKEYSQQFPVGYIPPAKSKAAKMSSASRSRVPAVKVYREMPRQIRPSVPASQYRQYAGHFGTTKPVVKNTPAVAARAAVKGVKKVAR